MQRQSYEIGENSKYISTKKLITKYIRNSYTQLQKKQLSTCTDRVPE